MSYIGNVPLSVAFLTDTFSGNGSTVAFTMSVAPANTSSVIVAITGVLQDPSTYSVSGTTLTFSAAPPTGTNNISVRYLGIPASGVTTTAYRTVTNFTATAGQTSFTTPSYTVGYIDVYRNGVRLGSADFTATTGTTVVLSSGASAGDLIVTESFYVSSVLNAIPATNNSINQAYLASGVAGTGPAFSAYASSVVTMSNNTWTKVTLNAEDFDTNSNFDTTNNRFTPTVAGYYQIGASILWSDAAVGPGLLSIAVYKNGASIKQAYGYYFNTTGSGGATVTSVIYFNGSTDYIELYGRQGSGTTISTASGSTTVYMSGALVRAA